MVLLCFGFVARIVLVTHQCFGFCWALLAQHQGFISPPLCLLQQLGQGGARSWERTQLAHLAKTDPNWSYSRLTKQLEGRLGRGLLLGGGNCLGRTCSLYPPSPTVPLSQPFAVPILSCIPPREGGSSWAVLQLLARVSPGKLQNLGNFILLFFSIYIKFAEESAHTGWCFLNLGTPNCLFQDQPSSNFANCIWSTY